MKRATPLLALLPIASLAACAAPPAPLPAPAPPPPAASASAAAPPAKPSTVAAIKKDARALAPLVKTDLARELLAAADDLPAITPRRLYRTQDKTRFYTQEQAARLPEAERAALVTQDYDEELFYVERWGSPLAYARAIDLLGLGKDGFSGKRVLDFGFGAIGQLRLFASLGARATGVDVDPLLAALYSAPGDQGPVRGRLGRDGEVRVLIGRFPADSAIKEAAGGGYDLFLSKNTLKRGYIHPERPADEKRLIKLGVDDETFVRTVFAMLVPGGKAMIYNLAPAPAPPDKPYIPWADGRCPFARDLWEKVGFRVIEFDRDDTPMARAFGHALEWDQGEDKMDLEHDLFGTYTLVEKPR
jgi:hypothetical protein